MTSLKDNPGLLCVYAIMAKELALPRFTVVAFHRDEEQPSHKGDHNKERSRGRASQDQCNGGKGRTHHCSPHALSQVPSKSMVEIPHSHAGEHTRLNFSTGIHKIPTVVLTVISISGATWRDPAKYRPSRARTDAFHAFREQVRARVSAHLSWTSGQHHPPFRSGL